MDERNHKIKNGTKKQTIPAIYPKLEGLKETLCKAI